MLGKRVEKLIDNVYTKSGFHEVNWNASQYPSGMYFIKVKTPSIINTRKALLIK
jgi:hypothetical protein